MLAFLQDLAYWHWLIFACVFFVLEIIIPGTFFFLCLAIASLATAGVTSLFVQMDWPYQGFIFVGFATLSIIALRMLLIRLRKKKPIEEELNKRESSILGGIYRLEDPIESGRGRVRIGDSTWSVEGPNLPKGTHVKVIKTKGTILVVEEHKE